MSNRYGNTDLDDLTGFVNLDVKYGNLTAAKLTRGNEKPISDVNLAYGNCSIDEAGWLDVTAAIAAISSINKKPGSVSSTANIQNLTLVHVSSVVGESRYDVNSELKI